MKRQIGATGLFLAAGAGLAGASVAWACSTVAPAAYVSVDPDQSVAGATVTVTGHNMNRLNPTNEPADITLIWENASQQPIQNLKRVAGTDSINVQVVIPASATNGIYNIGAVRSGNYANPASFQVANALGSSSGPANVPGGGVNADNSAYNLGGDSNPPQQKGSSGPTALNGAVRGASLPRPEDARGVAGSQATGPLGGAGRPGEHPPGGGGSSLVGGAGSSSGQDVLGNPSAQRPEGGNVPSTRVLSDLWGGFARGRTSSAAPGLVEVSDPLPAAAVTGAMIVGGLVALGGGFALAEVRRRRVAVHA